MKDILKKYIEKAFSIIFGATLMIYAFVGYYSSGIITIDGLIVCAVGVVLLLMNRWYHFESHRFFNSFWFGLYYGLALWLVYKSLYLPRIPITYLLGILSFFLGTTRVKNKKAFYHILVAFLVVLLPMIVFSSMDLDKKVIHVALAVLILLVSIKAGEKSYLLEGSQLDIQTKILDHAAEGFALHDLILNEKHEAVDYRFLAVNPAFEHITGMKKEEVEGKRVKELLPELEEHWLKTYSKVGLDMETLHFMNYSKTLDKHFQVSAFPVSKGRFVTFFTDVTQQVMMQKMMEDNENQLAALLKDKVGYLRDINHQLRNPINGVLGSLQLYEESKDDTLLKAAMKEAKEIHEIINSISSYVTSSDITYQYKKHDLVAVLKFLLSEFSGECEYKIINELNVKGILMFDEHVLGLTLKSICSLAESFSHTKPVIITLKHHALTNKLTITLKRFGYGYSEEEIKHLFRSFYHSYLEKELTINMAQIKMILRNAGGDLRLNSLNQESTTFIIELPHRII